LKWFGAAGRAVEVDGCAVVIAVTDVEAEKPQN
jgi:hypothetical protein